jgi:hypothetical protein
MGLVDRHALVPSMRAHQIHRQVLNMPIVCAQCVDGSVRRWSSIHRLRQQVTIQREVPSRSTKVQAVLGKRRSDDDSLKTAMEMVLPLAMDMRANRTSHRSAASMQDVETARVI